MPKSKRPTRTPKPWTDEKGHELSTEALKEKSKTWSPEVWEEYLRTLEIPQKEHLISRFDRLLSRFEASQADHDEETEVDSEPTSSFGSASDCL